MRPSTRLGAALLVALLVAVGCGSDDPAAVDTTVPVDTATTAGVDPGAAPPGGAAPVVTDPASGAVVDGGAPTGGGSGGGGGAPPGTAAPAPVPGPGSPVLDASGPPGSFGPSILRPASSSQLVLEIEAAPGAAPSAGVIEHARATLAAASGKSVVVTTTAAPSNTDWSFDSVRSTADAGAATAQGGGVAVIRLLFVHGRYEGEDGILGVAVRGDVAAVFVDRAAAAAGLLGDSEAILTSVTTHEVGHLLGLVDLVLATGRADPEHPGHSANLGSVMYWAVESDLIGSVLGAQPPRDFDADDLADLRAIAGG